MYYLIWKNEIIDEFDTESEAAVMRAEYALAYGGSVRITQRPTASQLADWEG